MKDPLLQPFTLGGTTIRNRIVSTSHAPAYAEDGMPSERYQLYHEEKAKGGIGMTMFGGSSCVSPDSPSVFGQLDVSSDRVIPFFEQFAARIHGRGAALICQISHLGRRTTWNAGDWLPVVAPSRVREEAHRGFPKEMDAADIARITADYAAAARRCKTGGLDGVELLHNGHLPGQFLSPHTNLRSDGYGGSLENRARFALEVLEAMRAEVGDGFTIGIRMEAESRIEGGLTSEEAVAFARMLQAQGIVDYLNLNVGRPDHNFELATFAVPAMFQKLAPWLPVVAEFRREVSSLPVIHACRISDLSTARYAVEQGIVDLVGMTRAHIADPHLVRKLEAGEEPRIRPCVGASYCIDRIYAEGEALCLHNPATGREKTVPHLTPKADTVRRVAVVGGGPAGLEAARVAAERGHRVVLFEAASKLGGQVRIAAQSRVRKDLIGITDWLTSEVETLGVDLRYNTFAGEEEIRAEDPDVVIVATGGLPDVDHFPGGDLCLSVWDVLGGTRVEGDVLIYDDNGQHQAPSLACELAARGGMTLTFVTPDRSACVEMGNSNYPMYLSKFHKGGVTVVPDRRIARVERDGNRLRATFSNDYGGAELTIVADHVVVEHGTIPLTDVFDDLRDRAANGGVTDVSALVAGKPQPPAEGGFALHRIGDAVASRNIHAAIYDARRLCLTI